MQTQTLAFIGGGHMARALIGGLLRQGRTPASIRVGEPVAEARTQLAAQFGVVSSPDNLAVLDGANVVVLAVKPQEMRNVLQAATAALASSRPLLVSIAAGIATADILRWCPGARVVRAMPNRPALLGAGVTGLYAPAGLAEADRQVAESVLSAAGRTVWVQQEALLDVVTALSGSGPAYFFLLAECLAQAGRQLGLPAETAEQLAAETLYGTGLLAHDDPHLAVQRQAVTSRGGTTAAALAVLSARGFDALVGEAVAAASRRSAELSAQFGGDA